ncbi:LOW QUALITY PROTEIN: potassium channel regulatory protein [Thomomys bottae]
MSGKELVTLIFTNSTMEQFPASPLARMLDGRDHEFSIVGGQIFVNKDVLFSFILDFLRNHHVLLPSDFSYYSRLQREALFYELDSTPASLTPASAKRKTCSLEVHIFFFPGGTFLNGHTQAFLVFGSGSKTIEMLTGRIAVFTKQLRAPAWNCTSFSPSMTFLLILPQRPYHDLLFQCSSDNTDKPSRVRLKFRYLVKEYFIIQLLVSVSGMLPQNLKKKRKLANGTNVQLILLKEGFHLVNTRKLSPEDKSECYSFERISPEVFTVNKTPESETVMPEQSQRKKRSCSILE